MMTGPATPPPATPEDVIKRLHDRCGEAIGKSFAHAAGKIARSYTFVSDLEGWAKALDGRREAVLYNTATQEYTISLLNLCEGQYRNAFKGLRLVLELWARSLNF